MSSEPTGNRAPSCSAMTSASRCGERDATAMDADQCQVLRATVLLDDLVADSDERTAHVVPGHDLPAHGALVLLAGLTGPVPGGFG